MTVLILKILFFMAIFLAGMYFYVTYTSPKQLEGLTTMNGELRCPNLLIQKDSKYYLYNSQIAKVPGVNPIEFNNLEEYVEFLEWQRSAGIRCPVLYVQNSYDAQGERVYKIRPSVTELQGGLPPSAPVHPSPIPINSPSTQIQNKTNSKNNVDEVDPDCDDDANLLFSPNPMCNKWGGAEYTQSLVDAGYYAGNEVSIYVP
jgi:hypothetical protein